MKNLKNRYLIYIAAAAFITLLPVLASAQRDYFTPEEIELIRDAQEIDARIDVLVHAIDRRFEAIGSTGPAPAPSKKEIRKWGALPEGTRGQMLLDIKRILQKAIDDIDSLAERPESAVISPTKDPSKKKKVEDIFPKAVKNLAKAAERYQPILKAELDKTKDKAEQGSILDSLDMCADIIASVDKLPTVFRSKKPE